MALTKRTGRKYGTNSNITIAGSDINAKGDLALRADNDINLIAAQNSDEQHSNRSSSSWGVDIHEY
ncbi:hypothetical protein GWL_11190 [Herbaspirillum sp. GW103]|uniref:hemagglutinin repeat-containing protein n=1 Tax=Herbaspirillum sp. GW103 TaxID=1175306 RepID=UPI00025E500D|nr:hemagglutinin repeat-containing protein [Herbaspirillum sp. GW103]EIJ46879.1 hypothetical protein GWL_11190 [Herbaspirillum sp. GW103]